MTTAHTPLFPLILIPRPDAPPSETRNLLQALPAAVTPVVLSMPPGPQPGQSPARAVDSMADSLAAQVAVAGVHGPFALYGWGAGAYAALVLAARLEVVRGHSACTALFVSDATAPCRSVPADRTPPPQTVLVRAAGRTVTESRLVVGSPTAVGGRPEPHLAPWRRNSTQETEFVALPRSTSPSWPAAVSGVMTARLPGIAGPARTPVAPAAG
ncbi:thioesterase domain-containing protein [Streptomyces sp. NPDC048521]|uniref:thioesterase domain-containing protein n=1 Tax=Streptomyces sp. NPDC048521 TaxID=3365566 RepID=UPI00372355FA